MKVKGFTLIEVMVALAIFAVAAMALTKVAMQYTQATSHAILRTHAQVVGLNEIARMEIQNEWLTGSSSQQVTEQGQTWQIDKTSESTISPNVQRIEMQVSVMEQERVKAKVSHLTFFNYRVGQDATP